MRGGPLLNHIQQKGFFTEQEASKVTRDIASALKYLHDQGCVAEFLSSFLKFCLLLLN